jgi:very-short-patch-repair endonuclease
VIQARLCAEVPRLRDTTVASSELGILEREIKKQRKHKPVRRLLAEIPGLLAKLAPCVLMSPLSVAQYLARGGQRFDLVVFDEASQIPMWDAVGAIGRGGSLVVVGDSKQLPPTSFFQRQAQGDEIASDEIPEDLESVLDECGAAGLPRLHLDWHYRSRHESLIAFSNHHYYKNRLLTFPAPQAIAPGLGVRSIRVAGVYDRAGSQQNKVEAEALVAEVKARLLDSARSRQSLGIVTFSQAQQVLIEDLLDQARRENPELEVAFGAASEPVFVKNLENVQGDERDVILFSICYGPDAQGRVFENYGPLNLQGGERRLNVAVTRARRELLVFTSVGPEQVAQRTQARGAQHLRAFLDYAQRGTAALQAAAVAGDPGSGTESPFETAVRDALVARGHEVHTQVGCSGYRIDLAVVDPVAPGRYLLGVECDGASYHSAATARDRDRLRGAVLKGLGWRLHRVWSTDFWQDPEGEIGRIEAALAAAAATVAEQRVQALAAAPAEPSSTALAETAPVPVVVEPVDAPAASAPLDADGPRPFVAAAWPVVGTPEEFQAAAALRVLRTQIQTVLEHEGPVVFDRLAWIAAAGWDLSRVTDRVRDRVRSAMPPTAIADGEVWWADAAQRDTFRGFREPGDDESSLRSVEELPPVEIANAMLWLLRQHQALAPDDLAREAARCFGITRLGAVVKSTMAAVIDQMLGDGRLGRDGEVLRPG